MRMRGEKGQTLVEVLIGVTLLAIVVVALMYGLVAGIYGTHRVDERATALNLAESQMEYIKFQTYNATYEIVDNVPPGFSITYQVAEITEGRLQRVTVTVSYDSKSVVLEDYKGKW